VRSPRPSTLAALVFALALALVGSTSSALYLSSMGPKQCCKSHCPLSKARADADADRCCATHLGVLPSALAKAAPDLDHAFAAVGTAAPALVVRAVPAGVAFVPAPSVLGRGSPPGSLVAAHTALLS
jgi:hypothetical protein